MSASRMPEDGRTRVLRMALFAAVYFAEGAVLTFFTGFNALYLRTYGVSYTRIGLVGGITLIPFVLKLFVGLLSDKVSLFGLGRRKPYIVIGLVLQAVAFFVLAVVHPLDQFPVYLTLIVLAALGMSTYDTVSDGFSVDTTAEADRGMVQGLMVGGRALSGVLAALVVGALSQNGQWSLAIVLAGGLALLVVPLALLAREPSPVDSRANVASERGTSVFRDWGFILFLILGLVYSLALYSASGMMNAFLNEGLGVSLARVGVYTSVFGIGTILGGVIGGPLMARLGRRTSIYAALVITAAATVGLAAVPNAGVAWAIAGVFGVAFGYYETAYFAVGMEFCDPRIAAFTFSFIMAVGNVGIGLGQPLAGALVEGVGFRWMFGVFALIHLVMLPVVYGVFRVRRDLA